MNLFCFAWSLAWLCWKWRVEKDGRFFFFSKLEKTSCVPMSENKFGVWVLNDSREVCYVTVVKAGDLFLALRVFCKL